MLQNYGNPTYEWAYALGAGVPVIPVLLDRIDLHPRLAALQYLEFTVPIHLRPWERLFASLRAVMADEAAKVHLNPDKIQELVSDLDNVDQSRRRDAISTLATTDQDDAREVLIAALSHRRRDVRISAALALAKKREERAIPGLVEALYDDLTPASGQASEALIQFGDSSVAPLIAALQSQNPHVQVTAANILGTLRSTAAVPALTERLTELSNSFAPNLKEPIITALGEIGHPNSVSVLVSILESIMADEPHYRESFVAQRTVEALEKIASPQAVPALIKALGTRSLAWERPSIGTALVAIGGATTIEALRSLLRDRDDDQQFRRMVTNLLQRLGVSEV